MLWFFAFIYIPHRIVLRIDDLRCPKCGERAFKGMQENMFLKDKFICVNCGDRADWEK